PDYHGLRTGRPLLEGVRPVHERGYTEIPPVLVSTPVEEELLFLHITVAEVQGHDEAILTNVGARIESDRLHVVPGHFALEDRIRGVRPDDPQPTVRRERSDRVRREIGRAHV